MINRSVWIMAVIVFVMSMLAACSSSENNGVNKSSNNNETATTEEDWDEMEADVVIYGQMLPSVWDERFGSTLKDHFPNYKFEFISAYDEGDQVGMDIAEMVAAGVKPDIYTGRVGSLQQRFMTAGLHTPMNEWMEKHGVDLDRFESQYFDSVSSEDGDIYMLPITNDGYVMYYNEALFDRFGLEHPTDGMSWDETIELANDFTRNQDGKQYVGLWYSPKHIMRVAQKSLNFVDPDTREPLLDSDDWHEWISKLFYEPMRNPGLQERAREEYFGHDDFRSDDVVGMYVYTTGWIRNHQSELPSDWNIVSVPTFDHDGVGVQPYAEYFGLASTSSSPDAAMRVLKYLTDEEFQTEFSRNGFMTPLKSQTVRDELYANIEGLDDKNIQSIFYNDLAPQRNITTFDEIVLEGPLHEEILTSLVRGLAEVNEAMQKAMDISRQTIEQEVLRLEAGE